jgi:2-hydroxycyclohexanecarboxyl-CoA dehydrogenase
MTTDARSLDGRCALVTGGAGGIGRAIARDLTEMGARVLVADVNLEGAQRVAATLPGAVALAVDLTNTESIDQLARDATRQGPPDILINCAGYDKVEPFLESTPDTWDRLLAINLRAVIQLTHALLPGMQERRWGRIINIASDAGRVGSTGEAVYSACKAGVIGFSKAVARESAAHGVTSNAVAPGPTDTPLLQQVAADRPRLVEALKRGIPLGRLGQPEDVAAAVAFLCSERAGYITGQALSVNGGMNMV